VRTRLSTLAVTLHNSLAVLYPPPQLSPEEEEAVQHAKFAELVAAANAERHALSLRRALVARRRELLSELSARKEKEEASRRAETTRREKDEEVRRAKLEMAKKERERAQKEVDSIRAEEAKKLAQTLIKKGNLKVSVDVRILFSNYLLEGY
jgi:translation initiation factor 3 subunit A